MTNLEANTKFQMQLQQEFTRRCRVNPRYSVRAFAQHIGADSSTISQILSGKRKVSVKVMESISTKLGLSPLLPKSPDDSDFTLIALDSFTVISDWYHYAILDLTLLKDFKSDINWIARKLAITPLQAQMAVDRLMRLGLLRKEKGKLKKGQPFYTNYSEGVTSSAHKEYHRQILTKALQAIDGCPSERKDITAMTIAADSTKLDGAREKIKKFRRELCAFLEDGTSDSVYNFSLQLTPLTSIEN